MAGLHCAALLVQSRIKQAQQDTGRHPLMLHMFPPTATPLLTGLAQMPYCFKPQNTPALGCHAVISASHSQHQQQGYGVLLEARMAPDSGDRAAHLHVLAQSQQDRSRHCRKLKAQAGLTAADPCIPCQTLQRSRGHRSSCADAGRISTAMMQALCQGYPIVLYLLPDMQLQAGLLDLAQRKLLLAAERCFSQGLQLRG